MSENVYLQDKNGQDIYPVTDWNNVQNKPSDLVSSNMLPKLGPWQRDGIEYLNGAYDWDHVNNGYNCAYRLADFGSFKMVELRLIFALNRDVTDETDAIKLPAVVTSDGDNETWYATEIRGIFIHMANNKISVYCQHMQNGDKYAANAMLSFHTTYFTTL